MGRRSIAIEEIPEERRRHVTFNKRKLGLFKKAMELSILCKAQILVAVIDEQANLYEYCSETDPRPLVQKYVNRSVYQHESYETLFASRAAGKSVCRPNKKTAIPPRATQFYPMIPQPLGGSRIGPNAGPTPAAPPGAPARPPNADAGTTPATAGGSRPTGPPTGFTPGVADVGSLFSSGFTPLPTSARPMPTSAGGPFPTRTVPNPMSKKRPRLPIPPMPNIPASLNLRQGASPARAMPPPPAPARQPPPPQVIAPRGPAVPRAVTPQRRNPGLKISVPQRPVPVQPPNAPESPLTPLPDEAGAMFKDSRKN